MTIKKRGLGRGLEALLVNVSTNGEKHQLQPQPVDNVKKSNHLLHDDMDADGFQELTNATTLADTFESVVVRKIAENNYEIVAGENRWRTARLSGLQEMPVIIKEVDNPGIGPVETIQKESLNLLQEAESLKNLIDGIEAMLRNL